MMEERRDLTCDGVSDSGHPWRAYVGGQPLLAGGLRVPFEYRGGNHEVVLPETATLADVQAKIAEGLPDVDLVLDLAALAGLEVGA